MAALVVAVFRLNHAGYITTEIVQNIRPRSFVMTKAGKMFCVCGHGRLRWRAKTFYTEEPETIAWLDSLSRADTLWDVGANVGLYSIYAAKVAKCKVLAFEPEAQNYALLVENIVLNNAGSLVSAVNLPITNKFGLGVLKVHALTRGGAYNSFVDSDSPSTNRVTESQDLIQQLQLGVSLDDMMERFQQKPPSFLKIDVDGNEPQIIAGAMRVLHHTGCRSILLEVQRNDPAHSRMVDDLKNIGFEPSSIRSNWESRKDRSREHEHPGTNMIFWRKSSSDSSK